MWDINEYRTLVPWCFMGLPWIVSRECWVAHLPASLGANMLTLSQIGYGLASFPMHHSTRCLHPSPPFPYSYRNYSHVLNWWQCAPITKSTSKYKKACVVDPGRRPCGSFRAFGMQCMKQNNHRWTSTYELVDVIQRLYQTAIAFYVIDCTVR